LSYRGIIFTLTNNNLSLFFVKRDPLFLSADLNFYF